MPRWITALPMYNVTPVLRDHWRSLVSDSVLCLREAGFHDLITEAADTNADTDLDALWRRDDLLLSQTCGYPLMRSLPPSIRIVATPMFDAPGCDGPRYSSALLVSASAYANGATSLSQCRGLRAAVNDLLSNSGMNVLRYAVAPFARDGRFFSGVVQTGSHVGSMRALAEGTADVAAIDCVTYAFAQEIAELARAPLHVLGFSVQTPGLPLIASPSLSPQHVDLLRHALQRALDSNPARARALRLRGFAHLTRDDYAELVELENQAIALGYPRLG